VPGLHPDPNLAFSAGILRFIKFPRHQTSAFIDFCKSAAFPSHVFDICGGSFLCAEVDLTKKFNISSLNMTGGGAYRYADEIQQKMQVPISLSSTLRRTCWPSMKPSIGIELYNSFSRFK
jgi:hypothetical protein